MPDTHFVEGGNEKPRRYSPVELDAIAKAAGVNTFGPDVVEDLQQSVESFQWAREGDPGGMFFRSNKEIRSQLEFIAKLCEKGASVEEIEAALSELDGPTLQKLGPISADDPQQIQSAVNRVLGAIPRSGPDPKRARRQFIGDLIRIFDCARGTGGQSGRRVDKSGQEHGPLREFVRAALEPFHAWQGCEADIKVALRQRNRAG
jgi:hypothetical protein